ncbi:MAG: 50S ribosomal protein L9 [Acidobacteriota bacterium]
MKVVLKHEIEQLGRAGDVVDVARGYARNYLVPKGMALAATASNLKIIEHHKKKEAQLQAREREEAEALAQQLTRTPLELAHRAGDTDTLYGAVTSAEVAFALEEKGFVVDRRKIQLDEPLKALGEYTIPIKLHPDVVAQLTVNVIREEF